MNSCRICSCTDTNCSWCVVLTDHPCFWSESDICSACFDLATDDAERARIRGETALRMARRRSGKAPGFQQLSDHGMQCLRVAARLEAALLSVAESHGMSTTTIKPVVARVHPAEAQYKLLYSVVVAGKSASFAEQAMTRFLADAGEFWPFDWISDLYSRDALESKMREARMGCYTRLTRSFLEISKARPDLLTAEPGELEALHGIGPKTARFAIMWVRPHERYAALDTHILKWLRFIGLNAPKATPSGELYAHLERIFIAEADQRSLRPRLLDAMIWEYCSQHREHGGPATWPLWLQKEPAEPPAEILAYFKSFAA